VEKRREERSGDGIEDIGACRRGKRAGDRDERVQIRDRFGQFLVTVTVSID
jgi:hypothetical protein